MHDDLAPRRPYRTVDARSPLFIVLNSTSGQHDGEDPRVLIEQELNAAGREYDFLVASERQSLAVTVEQAVAQARQRGGVVVAAGGDGTVNAVVQAMRGSRCPLGVIPLGTFNYFSRTHGIASDVRAAARQLLAARAFAVPVGDVNGRVFIVNASLGLYPKLLEDREEAKRYYARSRLVALWSGLLTLLREHRQLRLRIESDGDERVIRTPTLFVGINRVQLARLGIAQSEAVDLGRLVAIAPKPVGTLTLLWLVLRGALGRLGDDERVNHFAFTRLSVSPAARYGRRRVKIAIDGEVMYEPTPLTFSVAPEPIFLLRPERVSGDPG